MEVFAHYAALSQELKDATPILAEHLKELNEHTSQIRAITDDFESLLGLLDYAAYLQDMNNTNNLASADGTAIHSVDYTESLPIADGNITRDMVAECRFRAVVACRRQADCTYGKSDGSFARELAKCDALANVSIFETSCFAGTLVVLAIIAGMICSAFDLFTERQVRVLALGVTAVYLIVRFGGM